MREQARTPRTVPSYRLKEHKYMWMNELYILRHMQVCLFHSGQQVIGENMPQQGQTPQSGPLEEASSPESSVLRIRRSLYTQTSRETKNVNHTGDSSYLGR